MLNKNLSNECRNEYLLSQESDFGICVVLEEYRVAQAVTLLLVGRLIYLFIQPVFVEDLLCARPY